MLTFKERVWNIIARIPSGKVSTYKEVAHALGCKAYRAVGQALHKNPSAPFVPCHRIVGSNGRLGGYAYGCAAKEKLLTQEGINVQGGKIMDFEEHLFRFVNEFERKE